MPTQDFYVAQKGEDSSAQYVADIENGQPVFSSTLNDAQWSYYERIVEAYITANNIEDVKPKKETGLNHPPKPQINF